MTVTTVTLKALFPEFSAQSDQRVQSFLDMATRRVDTGVFGTLFDDAVSFLTAHMLTKAILTQSGGGLIVTTEKVGDLERSYAQHGAGATGYASTAYGAEFLKLRRAVTPSPMVV